jgi:plastocyanin
LRYGAASAALALAGCAASGGSDRERTVSMTEGFAFAPETVTVPPGTTVVWTNDSDVGHTVTAYGSSLPAGGDYFCVPHESTGMLGTVRVE